MLLGVGSALCGSIFKGIFHCKRIEGMQADAKKGVSDETRERFYAILLGQLPREEIEQWVYNSPEPEASLAGDHHLALLSLDYRKPDALYEVRKIIAPYVDRGDFETRQLLKSIVNRDGRAFASVLATYHLYCDGYYFLDTLG